MQPPLRPDLNSPYKQIWIAADHAGLDLKDHLIGRFPFLPWLDMGTKTHDSVDFPDYANALCLALQPRLDDSCGVLICGSGQGMAIAANRHPFIRAALCWGEDVAELARRHSDANVLCLAARLTDPATAERILTAFIRSEFEGGRHQRRVAKLGAK